MISFQETAGRRARLQAFAASTPRAVWQQRVDRFGPLMGLLFPASAR